MRVAIGDEAGDAAPGPARPVGEVAAMADDLLENRFYGELCPGAGKAGAVLFDAGPEALRQASRRAVKALAGKRQNIIGPRQTAAGGSQAVATLDHGAREAAGVAGAEVRKLGGQFAPHRHGALGGGGRGGGAIVGGIVDEGPVGLVADRRDQGDAAFSSGAHHDLLIEAPQVLKAAAATRHDEEIGAGEGAAFDERIEAVDRRGHLGGALLALDSHRPYQHMAGKAVGEAVEDVADYSTSGRGDDADDGGDEGQRLFSGFIEQALGGELFLALFQKRHEGAFARRLQGLDDDLVFRLAGKGGDAPGDDHLHALLGAKAQGARGSLPNDGGQHRLVVLQVEIDVTGAGGGNTPHLAAHPDMAECVLKGALEGLGEFGDRQFGDVGGGACLDDFAGFGVEGQRAGGHGPSNSLLGACMAESRKAFRRRTFILALGATVSMAAGG